MRLGVYAIKDLEKGSFVQPFFVPEGTLVNDVIVNFKRLIEKGDSEISYFPDRFELHKLNFFDVDVGLFEMVDGDTCVAKGIDFARPEYIEAMKKVKVEMDNIEKAD